nr:sugar transferase [Gemmatimonadota bacterium]
TTSHTSAFHPALARAALPVQNGVQGESAGHRTSIVRSESVTLREPARDAMLERDPLPIPRARLRSVERCANIFLSLALLIFSAPVLLLSAVAIGLTSPGPILFRQVRIGVDRRWERADRRDDRRIQDMGGLPFTIYKFRTMYSAPESAVWATPDDPRVTPLGRVLRRYRIDELPQLFNVLKGDMNLIGPRPEQPQIFAKLRQEIQSYSARQRVMPGITGLAQVRHHYDTCVDDVRIKLHHDLEYIRARSAVVDLQILVRTVPTVFLRRGGW